MLFRDRKKAEASTVQMGERARRIVAGETVSPKKSPVSAKVIPMIPQPVSAPVESSSPTPVSKINPAVLEAKNKIQQTLLDQVDISELSKLTRKQATVQLVDIIESITKEHNVILNMDEQKDLVILLVDDMFGLGPIEPLLKDDSITDIMVNGPDEVYIERNGLLEKSTVVFKDKSHIFNIATKIANMVGRRVDESSPMVDARLEDGSRVNIILPPLAFKSPTISIRKFAKDTITLDRMVEQENLSKEMAIFLKLTARAKLNILISGGTGSGKTTLLNAMSKAIDPIERIITIEDAAELRLDQPHVVTLEARPANLEGQGKIAIRDLLINSLRMRPDRIIVGEVRSGEVVDMLQAMNTGHDGSMGTIHANNPRDTFARLENLFSMSGVILPSLAIRTLIASAIQLVVQISRMSDGKRRIVSITELTGMEGDVITAQELFRFTQESNSVARGVVGKFEYTGIRPKCSEKIENAGYEKQLHEIICSS